MNKTVTEYEPYGKILREYNPQAEKYLTTHHERDTETGLDYRGARYYDSDIARFGSLDEKAADYPSLSSYNYVAGNPIIFVDTDGKEIVGIDGKPVTYTFQVGAGVVWSPNASQDFINVGNEMLRNNLGKRQLDKMIEAKHDIHIKFDKTTPAGKNFGNTSIAFETYPNGDVKEPALNKGVIITIFEKTHENEINSKESVRYGITKVESMAATMAHEGEHGADMLNIFLNTISNMTKADGTGSYDDVELIPTAISDRMVDYYKNVESDNKVIEKRNQK